MKSNIHFIFYILLTLVCSLISTDLFSNSDSVNRKIAYYGTDLIWYDQYDDFFTRYTGFKNSISGQPRNIRKINGANDTIYINKQIDGTFQKEIFWSKMDGYQMELLGIYDSKHYKWYSPNKDMWSISLETADGNYRWGRSYNSDKTRFFKIDSDENNSEDTFMLCLMFFFLVWISISLIFPYWDFDNLEHTWLCIFCISLILALFAVILLELNTLLQLTLPLFLIVSTSVLFKIPYYKGIIRVISQFILGVLIISFFGYKQFFSQDEELILIDGTKLHLQWQKGTCLVRRYYIKNMLHQMLPVDVSIVDLDDSNLKEYTLYVSKFEVSAGDIAIVNNELFSWFRIFMNSPLEDFSYREARFFLELLHKITGINFDFLTFPEWQSLSCGQKHLPNNLDYTDVDEGDINEDGLFNLTSNIPEYTSSYFALSSRLSYDTDTLVKSYNYVFVAGSAYLSNDSIESSVVNKNFREGRVGFRIIYRPNDIYARKFTIVGNLRSDRVKANLPKSINLLSIDGININEMDNYELFEEKLIESRFKDKIIVAIDRFTKDTITCFLPQGIEHYDFVPIFTFKYP